MLGDVYNNKNIIFTSWSNSELLYRMKIVSTRTVARLTMKVILKRVIYTTTGEVGSGRLPCALLRSCLF